MRVTSKAAGFAALLAAASLSVPALAQGVAGANAPTDAPVCVQLVASGNPEYPPYLWRDPKDDSRLVGAAAELMQKLAAEIGVPINMRYVGPWGRVQDEVRQGRVDLIAGAFFTLPRLEYMDYFQPPIHSTRSVVFSRSDRGFEYRKWSDLTGHKGLTVINNSFGEAFDRYAEKHLAIEKVSTLESAVKMLGLGRVDYMIYEEAPGEAFAAKLGIKNLRLAHSAISSEDLFLTLSYKSPCNTGALRGKIAQAMYKFAKDRSMDKLVAEAVKKWGAGG